MFNLKEWEDVGFGVDKDWKIVEVSCETNLRLCLWEVYVYKTKTNMDDIKFMTQHPSSSLVLSRHLMINYMNKIESKITSLNLPQMHKVFRMWSTPPRKLLSFKGESSFGKSIEKGHDLKRGGMKISNKH